MASCLSKGPGIDVGILLESCCLACGNVCLPKWHPKEFLVIWLLLMNDHLPLADGGKDC